MIFLFYLPSCCNMRAAYQLCSNFASDTFLCEGTFLLYVSFILSATLPPIQPRDGSTPRHCHRAYTFTPPRHDKLQFSSDLGLQEHRLDDGEYLAVIDEFMEAIFTHWPHVIVQFEDFQSKWAFKLLERYRHNYRMFNDDVQVSVYAMVFANTCFLAL